MNLLPNSGTEFRFPTVKVLDYKVDWTALERSKIPLPWWSWSIYSGEVAVFTACFVPVHIGMFTRPRIIPAWMRVYKSRRK